MRMPGDHVGNQTDPVTGLPVYSLYGKTRKPTPEMLRGIDVLVYDIQDIGCRSFTYISTMGEAMAAAAENGIEFVVLDRPNPLGGRKVEGPLVQDGFFSFVSQYRIPYVYGLTCGELAMLLNGEGMIGKPCNLHVVAMEGWKRDMVYEDTGVAVDSVVAAYSAGGNGLFLSGFRNCGRFRLPVDRGRVHDSVPDVRRRMDRCRAVCRQPERTEVTRGDFQTDPCQTVLLGRTGKAVAWRAGTSYEVPRCAADRYSVLRDAGDRPALSRSRSAGQCRYGAFSDDGPGDRQRLRAQDFCGAQPFRGYPGLLVQGCRSVQDVVAEILFVRGVKERQYPARRVV